MSKQVYEKYGEDRCWQFFDENHLRTMDDIRDHFGVPITVNNWTSGGRFQQRGLRCNLDELVKDKTDNGDIYLSDHCLAKAFDFDVRGYSAEMARQSILDNQDKFPYISVIEGDVNWIHIGFRNSPYDGIRVIYD